MAEVPDSDDDESTEPTTITEGYFEQEFEANAEAAGEFLIDLGEQLREGDGIVVTGDDWEIPFAFDDTVEIEVEFEGEDEPELEIEVELEAPSEDETPDIS